MKTSANFARLAILAATMGGNASAYAVTTTVDNGGAFIKSGETYNNGVNDTLIINGYNTVFQGSFSNHGKAINNSLLYVNGPFSNYGSFDSKVDLLIQGSSTNITSNNVDGVLNLTGSLSLSRNLSNAGTINVVPPVGGESVGPEIYLWSQAAAQAKITNTGLIRVDTQTNAHGSTNNATAIYNNGTLEITERGVFNLSGKFLQTSGETIINGIFNCSTSNCLNSYNTGGFRGGVLRGKGTIRGSSLTIPWSVSVMPGAPFGTLTIEGPVAFWGTLDIELGGPPGSSQLNDRLYVNGSFIDMCCGDPATLNVLLRNGYTPNAGDSFLIVETAGNRNGGFVGDGLN